MHETYLSPFFGGIAPHAITFAYKHLTPEGFFTICALLVVSVFSWTVIISKARQLIRAGLHDPAAMTRPYALPPGTPKERVQLLRKAFLETLKDPSFVAEAKKSNLDVDPVSGEELERLIEGFFKLEPTLLVKLKEVLK